MGADGPVRGGQDLFARALEVIGVYESCLDRPAFREVGRDEVLTLRRLLEHAITEERRSELDRKLAQALHYKSIVQCPIMGIVGQLNAGKSTVLSLFLSPQGRARVPRGTAESKGTHRFVYWVPQSWLDNRTTREALFDLLRAAHGDGIEPEELPHDPAEAEEVYRSGRDDPQVFGRPVIAGDENLNHLNAGFLDTPDVQTDDETGARRGHKSRLELVGEAAALCSAILFVVDYAYLRDGRMKKFFDRVRGAVGNVPLFFLLNRLDPTEAHALAAQLENSALDQYQGAFQDLYVAYNYSINGWQERLPASVRHRVEAEFDGERLPFFFAVCPEQKRPIEPVQSLRDLPQKLSWGRLQRERAEQLGAEVIRALEDVVDEIRSWRERREEKLKDTRRRLLDFCVRQFKTEDGYRVPLNRKFLEEANEAMRRTAPWYARPAIAIQGRLREWIKTDSAERWVEKTRTTVANLAQKATGTEPTAVRAQEFAEQLQQMRWVNVHVKPEDLVRGWEWVFRRLEKLQEGFVYDPEELDRIAREIWKRLPALKKLQYVFASAAPVLLALSALDGGLTVLHVLPWLSGHLPGTLLLLGAAASPFVGQ